MQNGLGRVYSVGGCDYIKIGGVWVDMFVHASGSTRGSTRADLGLFRCFKCDFQIQGTGTFAGPLPQGPFVFPGGEIVVAVCGSPTYT